MNHGYRVQRMRHPSLPHLYRDFWRATIPLSGSAVPTPQPERLNESSCGQSAAPPTDSGIPIAQTTLKGLHKRTGGLDAPFRVGVVWGRSYPVAASACGGLATVYCLAGLQPATPDGRPLIRAATAMERASPATERSPYPDRLRDEGAWNTEN